MHFVVKVVFEREMNRERERVLCQKRNGRRNLQRVEEKERKKDGVILMGDLATFEGDMVVLLEQEAIRCVSNERDERRPQKTAISSRLLLMIPSSSVSITTNEANMLNADKKCLFYIQTRERDRENDIMSGARASEQVLRS